MTTRKKLQISSSSNNHPTQISEFKFLPPEIWTQIFEKLPAKTLLKLRCVSKSWCSIIDQPEFIHSHPQISQTHNSGNDNRSLLALEPLEFHGNRCSGCLLTVCHPKTLQETSLIIRKSDWYSYRIIGSCNGLILVNRNSGFYVYEKELRLWNPSIRKPLVIPACPFSHADTVYVFGYAPVNKDYKVIAIASEKGDGQETREMYVAIYTLSGQQWIVRNDGLNISLLNAVKLFQPFYCLSAAVFLKGVAYWLGNVDKKRNELTHLCSCDFDKEEIVLLELPSSWDEKGSFRFLFLFGESVAIFIISEVASSIWVLDQDNKKEPWTRRFLGKSSRDGYELFRYFVNEKAFFCESDGGYFIRGNKSYNIASCETREYEGFNSFYLQLEMYSESLVLSNGYGARDLRFFL